MANIISVEYPEYLANSMRLNKGDFEKEIKTSSLVKMFELGKVSSGILTNVSQAVDLQPQFISLYIKLMN